MNRNEALFVEAVEKRMMESLSNDLLDRSRAFDCNQKGPSTEEKRKFVVVVVKRRFFFELPSPDFVTIVHELKLIVVVVRVELSFRVLVELNVVNELDVDIPNIPKRKEKFEIETMTNGRTCFFCLIKSSF